VKLISFTQLKNSHALITGAGKGIGRSIALELSGLVGSLTLIGRQKHLLEEVQSLVEKNCAVQIFECDITQEDTVKSTFQKSSQSFGPVGVLINNAGQASSEAFHKTTLDQWQNILNINLTGTFLCTQACIQGMIELPFARVINIASTASQKGYPYVAAYTAAKHGVLGLTRSLALEYAKTAITFNAICPGFTDTDIVKDSIKKISQKTQLSSSEALNELIKNNPQKRLIDPLEIAHQVLTLCHDQSHSINGQALSISGGEVMG
jgi:NAD(P)-dependent dehydrogenase (short-subunit alcohol dehydrogenase family)